jgi:hypothetical protein
MTAVMQGLQDGEPLRRYTETAGAQSLGMKGQARHRRVPYCKFYQ